MQKKWEATIDKKIMVICELAQKKDKEALIRLKKQGQDINEELGDFSAVAVLAYQGHEEAVYFLLDNFSASLEQAIRAASWGKQLILVKKLLAREKNQLIHLHYALISGFVRAEIDNEVWQEKVLDFYKICPPPINPFCEEPRGGLFKLLTKEEVINDVLKKKRYFIPGQLSRKDIIQWLNQKIDFTQYTFREKEKIETKLYSIIKILDEIPSDFAVNPSITDPYKQPLNFKQAQYWMNPKLHFWFLTGRTLYKNKSLTLDLFLLITSYAFEMTLWDTTILWYKHKNTVPKLLRNYSIQCAEQRLVEEERTGVISTIKNKVNKFSPGFFTCYTKEDFKAEKEAIEFRYLNRITF